MKSILKIVRGIFSLVLLVISLPICQMAQLTFGFLLKPFSNKWSQKVSDFCYSGWLHMTYFCLIYVSKIKVEWRGDSKVHDENTIIICNHQSMADISLLFAWSSFLGNAHKMRFFAKDQLRYVPFMGWAMTMAGHIFLKRNWDKDYNTINETFARTLKKEIPTWLVCFPEGTRWSLEKQKKSSQLAIDKNYRVTKHVLLPRTKGFISSVIGLRGYVNAVYDVTINYQKNVIGLLGLAMGKNEHIIVTFKRISIDELPQDETKLANWLRERFVQKDLILNH